MARKPLLKERRANVPINVRVHDLMVKKYGADQKQWPTRDELARLIGVQSATVTAWLKNRVDRVELDTLDKWCKFLDAAPGDILVRKE